MSAWICLLVMIGFLAVGREAFLQTIASDRNASLTPSDIARLHVECGAVVKVPAKEGDAVAHGGRGDVCPMPGGMSSVARSEERRPNRRWSRRRGASATRTPRDGLSPIG